MSRIRIRFIEKFNFSGEKVPTVVEEEGASGMGSCGEVQPPAVVGEEELVCWGQVMMSQADGVIGGRCEDRPIVFQSDSTTGSF